MCSDIKELFAQISKNVRHKNLTRNTQQAQYIRRITPGKPDHDQHGRATGPEPGTWHPYGWPGSGGTSDSGETFAPVKIWGHGSYMLYGTRTYMQSYAAYTRI